MDGFWEFGRTRCDEKALVDEREAHFTWVKFSDFFGPPDVSPYRSFRLEVEEHGVYDIQPRTGAIAPGDFLHVGLSAFCSTLNGNRGGFVLQLSQVKFTYHHHSIGTHILPVVFNVHDGRSVLFYLKGHSVAPSVGCLSVRSSVLSLQPVPLGALFVVS